MPPANHERSPASFTAVANALVLVALGFLVAQFSSRVEVKLAEAPAPAAKSISAGDYVTNFYSLFCLLVTIWGAVFGVYYCLLPSCYYMRLVLDEISVIFGWLSVLILSLKIGHYTKQGKIIGIVGFVVSSVGRVSMVVYNVVNNILDEGAPTPQPTRDDSKTREGALKNDESDNV